MFFKVKSFLLFFQFLFFTIGIDGSHLSWMFGHVVLAEGDGKEVCGIPLGMKRGGKDDWTRRNWVVGYRWMGMVGG